MLVVSLARLLVLSTLPQFWGYVLLETQGENVRISRGLFPSPMFCCLSPGCLGHRPSVPVSGFLLVPSLP